MNAHTLMFFDHQKGEAQTKKGDRKSGSSTVPCRNFDPPDLPKEPSPTEKGATRGEIPSFERRKGPRAGLPPCMSTTMKAAIHLGPHYIDNLEVGPSS